MHRIIVMIFWVVSCMGIGEVYSAPTSQCQGKQCVGIVDAGSTGSRLHIYSYDLDATNTPINIQEIWSNRVKPGFATLDANQVKIEEYLTTLFTNATEQNIPVYFYATAGMRLHSQPKQQQYYNMLQKWFTNKPQWKLQEAKTITGKEEGIFGWLAVNYRVGTLTQDGIEPVGVLDMGGASVQISFPVDKTSNIFNGDIVELDIYGRHRTLFVHSFLGLGQTLLTQQFLDEKSCFADEYQLPSGVTGDGDALICEKDIAKLINVVHDVAQIVKPAVATNSNDNWYALGGLNYLVDSKPFHFDGQLTSQDMLDQADTEICHKSWSELSSQYQDNEMMYEYCLLPAYFYALIVDGYGLQPTTPIQFLSNPQSTDWTLGAVLNLK
jgi:hypothetical protein